MRYKERLDLALIAAESERGALSSGVFTTNRFTAAPVELCKEHLKASRTRAILINAGIANACTGEEGLANGREMAGLAAKALNVSREAILVSSTGVIGRQIRLDPLVQAMPALVASLRADGWEDVSRAIMTTDTVPKTAVARVALGGKEVTIGGVAKGSGMIAPNMATLLVFVCTDAAVEQNVLDHWVRYGADHSFNCITVDGDTSTNDSLIVLANGHAENPVLVDTDGVESLLFGETLKAVLLDLAKQVVLDGEGATKFIEIRVAGAPDLESAKGVAFTIAHSPLVKTAFFGEDANWGRIVAAAGRSGVPLIPEKVTLFFNGTCVFKAGTPVGGPDIEEKATKAFHQPEINVLLDLGMGDSQFTAFTCDLSYDYVKINASYRS
jgi:glutamate N-acetyltransferase/amino-acid N-acetyltransferase